MRGVMFAALAGLLLAPGAVWAVDEVGRPAATLAPGECAMALEGGRSWRDLDITLTVGTERLASHGRPLRRTPVTLRFDLGLLEDVEVFCRVGMSHSEAVDAVSLIGEDADGDKEFTTGGGVRATLLHLGPGAKLGASAQVNYHHLDDDALEFDRDSYDFSMDLLEVTAAVGVDVKRGPISLFGGLMASFLSADADLEALRGGVEVPAKADVDPSGNLGGFLGLAVEVTPRVMLTFSGHLIEGGGGVGGSLAVRL